jgi:sugar lactone lactonase YvrE
MNKAAVAAALGLLGLALWPAGCSQPLEGVVGKKDFVTDPPPQYIWVVTSIAGNGTAGFADGSGVTAQFSSPQETTVDGAGNLYVTDSGNHRIRKIDLLSGYVSTIAGSSTSGDANGIGTAAQFNAPSGITLFAGDLYVADSDNHRIRKIDLLSGYVSTIAGSSTSGDANGIGTAAQFNYPRGITADGAGNLYVADSSNHRIRKIESGGNVTTIAGSTLGDIDGIGTAAQFNAPAGITIDGAGNLYVAESGGHRIRKIDLGGNVTTIAGDGTAGYADGFKTAAKFNVPFGITVDGAGNLYVADRSNNRIRKIDSGGNVTTIAGDGIAGYADGAGAAARFNGPHGITVDGAGNLYVTDRGNHRIRKLPWQQIN